MPQAPLLKNRGNITPTALAFGGGGSKWARRHQGARSIVNSQYYMFCFGEGSLLTSFTSLLTTSLSTQQTPACTHMCVHVYTGTHWLHLHACLQSSHTVHVLQLRPNKPGNVTISCCHLHYMIDRFFPIFPLGPFLDKILLDIFNSNNWPILFSSFVKTTWTS